MPASRFYVYLLYREDGTPFYCGKGCGNRWLVHEKEAKKEIPGPRENLHKRAIIRAMLASGLSEVPKAKLCGGITSEDASIFETETIAAIGRSPYGPLVNLTDGGEGAPGRILSVAQRKRMSDAQKIVRADPAIREAMSECTKRLFAENAAFRERHAEGRRRMMENTEWRKNVVAAVGRRSSDPQWRANVMAACAKLADNPEWRKNLTEANRRSAANPIWMAKNAMHIADLAKSNQGKKRTPEQRRRISDGKIAADARRAAERDSS